MFSRSGALPLSSPKSDGYAGLPKKRTRRADRRELMPIAALPTLRAANRDRSGVLVLGVLNIGQVNHLLSATACDELVGPPDLSFSVSNIPSLPLSASA